MIKFNVKKPRMLGSSSIERAKRIFLQKVGDIILEELFIATSSKGPESLGLKTGLLRQSLRMDMIGDQVSVYFDPQVAVYSKFVLGGTKFIESKNIVNKVFQRVQEGDAYAQARTKLLNSIGLGNAY